VNGNVHGRTREVIYEASTWGWLCTGSGGINEASTCRARRNYLMVKRNESAGRQNGARVAATLFDGLVVGG
jgi:hypothetical protein